VARQAHVNEPLAAFFSQLEILLLFVFWLCFSMLRGVMCAPKKFFAQTKFFCSFSTFSFLAFSFSLLSFHFLLFPPTKMENQRIV